MLLSLRHSAAAAAAAESAMFSCYVTNTLLISLFAMHIWWFGLLLNMVSGATAPEIPT